MMNFKFQPLVVLLIALYVLIIVDAAPTPTTTSDFLYSNCTQPNTIAITFDDGPRHYTHELLDHLKNLNVKATFFMNGHGFEDHCIYSYADIVKRAFDEGHQIASHSWSHLDFTTVSKDEIDYQLEKLETAFKKMIGAVPVYFRPPYGAQNESVQEILKNKGYKMILWNMDTTDFNGDYQASLNTFISAITNSSRPSSNIILNHDRVLTTSSNVESNEALGSLEAKKVLEMGYIVTTVGGCTGTPDKNDWYRDIGKPQQRDDTWTCTYDDMHLPPKQPAAPLSSVAPQPSSVVPPSQ